MSEYTPTTEEVKQWFAGAVDEYRCDTGLSYKEAEQGFDRWLAAHDEQTRADERRQARDYTTKWREEACALIKATGHAPNDVMEDEFRVNVQLGYYEAWEIEREIDGHPVAEDGEYNPACCRFPKSCSCPVYHDAYVSPEDLEEISPRALPNHVHPQRKGQPVSDFTPTTEVVRDRYAYDAVEHTRYLGFEEAHAQFDRWLTAHDNQIRADGRRVSTVEELAALPAKRTVLLSEPDTKNLEHGFLIDVSKGSHGENVVYVHGRAVPRSERARYLPAVVIWQGRDQ